MSAAPGTLHLALAWSDWLNLFGHFLLLSMMSIGGAISTSSEMHRYLVEQHAWLTPDQFNAAIALAQAAPGPNVLFVALMGWHVGMNAGSLGAALFGVLVCMVGIMTPSTIITYTAAQWGHRNRDLRAVRAFKQGMAPVVIGGRRPGDLAHPPAPAVGARRRRAARRTRHCMNKAGLARRRHTCVIAHLPME
jgi:hypothetical protein